jgi:hypothetical protein
MARLFTGAEHTRILADMRSLLGLLGAAVLSLCACSAGSDGDDDATGGTASNGPGSGPSAGGSTGSFTTGAGGGMTNPNCSDAAKLIYVVSVEYELYSFDPNINGTSAYKLVGPLNCPSSGSPQSMAVSRDGTAYVFYDTGDLFRVSTADASCAATSYAHPVTQPFSQLGMGFTATTPDSEAETLYIVSPDFGLATVALPTFEVTQTGALVEAAELTGGPDATLFRFAASSAALGEINRQTLSATQMHTFQGLQGTQAWAFSRYAGKFFMFTSPGAGIPSTTTVYDPFDMSEMVRDQNVGFTIVGAGQSTCVPPPMPK